MRSSENPAPLVRPSMAAFSSPVQLRQRSSSSEAALPVTPVKGAHRAPRRFFKQQQQQQQQRRIWVCDAFSVGTKHAPRRVAAPRNTHKSGKSPKFKQNTLLANLDESEDEDEDEDETADIRLSQTTAAATTPSDPRRTSFPLVTPTLPPSSSSVPSDPTDHDMIDLLDHHQNPKQSTPTTTDFMIDVFSNNHTTTAASSSSPSTSSLEYQNLKTPTSQSGAAFSIMTNQIGGMVGAMNPNTFSVAVESDANFAMVHLLDRAGVDALVKARYQYPPREAYTRLPLDHLSTHYKLIHRLGRGSFADVFKVQLLPTTHPHTPLTSSSSTNTTSSSSAPIYAIKKTRVPITGPKDRKFQLQELVLQYHLTSLPHIIHLHTAWEQYASLYLVMEFCSGGTLAQYIDRKRDTGVDEFVVWGVLGQLARGVSQMHARQVVHLDLKPGNVLIGGEGEGVLKVGDFGCASFLPVPEGFEKEGDRRYMAPEILEGRYGPECDVFR
ncbi:hypothetical protein HDU98_006241 [Podochytrium sp. JEL0797]|nr:hypothetical protein HDU98_006241 [Podochytrium sp. JEL0797]